ncbi:MAG TPA: hypothetical protein VEQ12_03625 [Candidatus Limnocylindria bacterium]|nr:hypothetical protein [Candidatus Limnocylindria bacterium]
MAERRPGQKLVYRRPRKVSWGTRIAAVLMLGLAGVGFGGFLLVILPKQSADLGTTAAAQVVAAQQSTGQVGRSVTTLWGGITPTGSVLLSPDKVTAGLAAAQAAEKAADAANTDIQAALAVLLQADGIPFQLSPPPYIAPDRAILGHLDKVVQSSRRLAYAASLQFAIAQHAQQDQASVAGTLKPALAARNWVLVARTAATLKDDLKAQVDLAATPEALMDPAWGKWLDGLAAYDYTAQQYALAESSGQSSAAQGLRRTLDQQDAQVAAAWSAAVAGNAAWQHSTVQPILDSLAKELATGHAA